jgi:hypothetical protein
MEKECGTGGGHSKGIHLFIAISAEQTCHGPGGNIVCYFFKYIIISMPAHPYLLWVLRIKVYPKLKEKVFYQSNLGYYGFGERIRLQKQKLWGIFPGIEVPKTFSGLRWPGLIQNLGQFGQRVPRHLIGRTAAMDAE